MNLAQILNKYPEVAKLLEVVGTPYCWGAGDLKTVQAIKPSVPSSFPQGWDKASASMKGHGIDCSGLAQWCLWVLGDVRADAWVDLSAHDLANACDAVELSDVLPGDLYFYKYPANDRIHHVTIALGGGLCLHASGDSKTFGDNPARCVEVKHYSKCGPFLVAGRLKQKFRRN